MGEQMRGLIPAFFDNQEQLDNAQNAIAFCTGHDLAAATDAGVTLGSLVGALRNLMLQVESGRDNWGAANAARAILAHFPIENKDAK